MIDFMIIGLPRSATTWAANWLTTDTTHCYHDPLYTTHYEDWDGLAIPDVWTGVSCTGIWRWPDWVNGHPSRKLILHRELGEVNHSLLEIGLPPLSVDCQDILDRVIGLHVPFSDVFDPEKARDLWEYLSPTPFNPARHRELVKVEMQPQFSSLSVGEEVTRRLREELAAVW